MTFKLQGLPRTSLEGSGQAQLPQLRLHGVRELLQGPRVQAHGESCFVSSTGVVHFRVFREPPSGKRSGEGKFLTGSAAHLKSGAHHHPPPAYPSFPSPSAAGSSQPGAPARENQGFRNRALGTSSYLTLPLYRISRVLLPRSPHQPFSSSPPFFENTHSFTSSLVRLVKRRPTSPLNFLLTYRIKVRSVWSY